MTPDEHVQGYEPEEHFFQGMTKREWFALSPLERLTRVLDDLKITWERLR